jgi:hypothetical protein
MSYTIEGVLKDPENAPIDKSPWGRLITAKALIAEGTADNFDAVVRYIGRPEFPLEIQYEVISQICRKDHNVLNTKAFFKWAKTHPLP